MIVSRKGASRPLLSQFGKNNAESMLNGNAIASHCFVNPLHEMSLKYFSNDYDFSDFCLVNKILID
ncbi:hypothetical protein AGR13a_Cc20196 [Agrobacterium genomosp. 13 str. CFBP 6927]|uniref:Uncharacterized protein n=1 Tax=Agrobacterium genomosp. 13 str. CFBP 6927 TaxID=1183428 RepID=A0ABP2BF82_9HYPH|nr:hypothetical protein AGR13a_Cc20196 [Agrobacterium genomosp. 13 str. CFBP 6927]